MKFCLGIISSILKAHVAFKMDPARRKALGRSNPKQGKLKRVKRTTSLLRRQSELPCQGIRVGAHICVSQRIRHGLRRIYGMRRECTWRTCGITGWFVPFISSYCMRVFSSIHRRPLRQQRNPLDHLTERLCMGRYFTTRPTSLLSRSKGLKTSSVQRSTAAVIVKAPAPALRGQLASLLD